MKLNHWIVTLFLCISLLFVPKADAADDGTGSVVIIGSTVVGIGIGWWIMHSIREGAEAPEAMIKEFGALRKGLLSGKNTRSDLDAYVAKVEKDSTQLFIVPRIRSDYLSALRMRTMIRRDTLGFQKRITPFLDSLPSSTLALAEVNGATQAAVQIDKKALNDLMRGGLGNAIFPAVGGNFLFADSQDFQSAIVDTTKSFPRLLATGMKKAMKDSNATPRWNLRYKVLESKQDSSMKWRSTIGFAIVAEVLPGMLPDLKDSIYVAMSKVLFLTVETDKPLPESRPGIGAFAGILMGGKSEAEETPKNVGEKLKIVFQQNDKFFQLR